MNGCVLAIDPGNELSAVVLVQVETYYILRQTIKAHLYGNANAKDENVVRVLKDRFREKGTKKCPEFFRGDSSDVWLVFALAVTYIDQQKGAGPDPGSAIQPDAGPSK